MAIQKKRGAVRAQTLGALAAALALVLLLAFSPAPAADAEPYPPLFGETVYWAEYGGNAADQSS